MKKIFALMVSVAILALSLAGCGSAKSNKVKVIDIPLTSEKYSIGVDKNQPELLDKVNKFIAQIKTDGTYDKILNEYFGDGTPQPVTSAALDPSKDQLVVATNAGFEPFEYLKGDQYYGIDMEMASLFAKSLGKELVISNMDFDAVCLSVGQGKADLAVAGLSIKEDRKVSVDFSDTYYDTAQKLIAMEDDKAFDNCKTTADVEAVLAKLNSDTKIGVQQGTTGQFYVQGDTDSGYPGYKVKCVGYKSGSLAVQDMINGNVKYVVIDDAPAKSIVKAMNALN